MAAAAGKAASGHGTTPLGGAAVPVRAPSRLIKKDHLTKRTLEDITQTMNTKRTLLFGYGNHKWPNSRMSAGLSVVSSWAKTLNLSWEHKPIMQVEVAETPRLLLVRPTSYLEERLTLSARRLLQHYGLTSREAVFVYPDEEIQVGFWKEVGAGGSSPHILQEEFADRIGDNYFSRIGVGVGKPPDKGFQLNEAMGDAFFCVKPPEEEMALFHSTARSLHAFWNAKYREEVAEIKRAQEAAGQAQPTMNPQ